MCYITASFKAPDLVAGKYSGASYADQLRLSQIMTQAVSNVLQVQSIAYPQYYPY
jgi:hypothetical protein